MIKEVALPSGATLKIQPAKFADARALLAAASAEFRGFELDAKTDMAMVYKELGCIAMSSPAVEKALWKCMESCLYVTADGTTSKLSLEVFEPVERREDYTKVLMEVAKENIGPFMKSLFALFSQAQGQGEKTQTSESQTMTS